MHVFVTRICRFVARICRPHGLRWIALRLQFGEAPHRGNCRGNLQAHRADFLLRISRPMPGIAAADAASGMCKLYGLVAAGAGHVHTFDGLPARTRGPHLDGKGERSHITSDAQRSSADKAPLQVRLLSAFGGSPPKKPGCCERATTAKIRGMLADIDELLSMLLVDKAATARAVHCGEESRECPMDAECPG